MEKEENRVYKGFPYFSYNSVKSPSVMEDRGKRVEKCIDFVGSRLEDLPKT
jgi:hypothetical protein